MGLGGAVIGGVIGSLVGGIWGTVIGAGVGAYLTRDKTNENGNGRAPTSEPESALHLIPLFQCMGKLAKADGAVSQNEADFTSEVLRSMDLPKEQRQQLIAAFSEGKNSSVPFGRFVRDLRNAMNVKGWEMAMDIFCTLVIADGKFSPEEKSMLAEAEQVLSCPGYVRNFMRSHGLDENGNTRSGGSSGGRTATADSDSVSLADAYKTLGVTASATDDEIKKAWRQKALEFHPDKIQGKGLSDAFIQFATEETRRINNAYDLICRKRGIK